MERDSSPAHVQYHLTNRCNLDCRFCWRHKDKGVYRELDDATWMRIAGETSRLGVKRVTISGGGEPLLRKELVGSIAARLKGDGIHINLITNGVFLEEADARALIASGIDEISYSIHGFRRETDAMIRGVSGSAARTERSMRLISSMKSSAGLEVPVQCIRFVLTRLNHDMILDTVKKAGECGIRRVFVRTVNESENDFHGDLSVTAAQHEEVLSQIERSRSYAASNGIDLVVEFDIGSFRDAFSAGGKGSQGEARARPGICRMPFTELVIFANGKVSGCCNYFNAQFRPEEADGLIDDISEKSLEEIWRSGMLAEFRKRLKEGNPPAECRRCTQDFLKEMRESVR